MAPFPSFITRSELKRLVHVAREQQDDCRVGQAVCNQWRLAKELEDKIYESNDFNFVVSEIYQYYYGMQS